MHYQDIYEHHSLVVWTTKWQTGWTWAYSIDDGAMVESEGSPNLSEAFVLNEGIEQSRRAVQALQPERVPSASGDGDRPQNGSLSHISGQELVGAKFVVGQPETS